jgi:hypothetical protein
VNELEKNHPIIYLDESGFKSHDYRPHGYSRKGVPCLGQYNWQLKNQTNAIEQSIKGIYFQSVYLTAKSIQMFFIFGLSNSSYQNYQKIV